MKLRLSKVLALNLGIITGACVGVLFKEGIDTSLQRAGGIGGEILIIPLIFLLVYLGYYMGREIIPVKQGKEGIK